MLIVTATMYPHGNPATSYEVLHASISNVTSRESPTGLDSYTAHVLCRPAPHIGVEGYESDVEVQDHLRRDGLPPLLASILCAGSGHPDLKLLLPPSREVAHMTLQTLDDFDRRLRGRT